ncbi:MAG: hypothetical protein HWD58_06550 [Bacteroidota bacterium]|nr:MAG: hypothetical protein HWD58_06550 [Bacteroidota bacterium]
MAFKASEHPVAMQAPQRVPTSRKGFTVVEWGGVDMSREAPMMVKNKFDHESVTDCRYLFGRQFLYEV